MLEKHINLSNKNITSDYSPVLSSQADSSMQEPIPTSPVAPKQGESVLSDGRHGPLSVAAQSPVAVEGVHVNGSEFKLRRLIDGCMITAVDDGIKSPILDISVG
jgi:hypothetical protein